MACPGGLARAPADMAADRPGCLDWNAVLNSRDIAAALPDDVGDALLVGRIETADGPTPVLVCRGRVFDLSAVAATVANSLAHGPGRLTPGPTSAR